MKKTRHIPLYLIVLLCAVLFLSGCGGCGRKKGSSNSSNEGQNSSNGQTAVAKSVVSGIAVKGVIRFGRVELFSLDENGGGSLIATTFTDSQTGIYSFEEIDETGSLRVIVREGNYEDEASGENIILEDGDMMTAFIPSLSPGATTIVNITPITTMAARLAENLSGGITPSNIEKANRLINRFFGISDILSVTPINTLNEDGAAEKSGDAIDYGLILAGISQYAFDLGLQKPFDLVRVLADDASDGIFNGKINDTVIQIEGDNLPPATGYIGIIDASHTFSNNLDRNRSGGVISDSLNNLLTSSGGLISAVLPPKIFSISPSSGPLSGGIEVIVKGRPILDGAGLSIGGKEATVVKIEHGIQDDSITATIPAGDNSGQVDIVVTNPDGQTGLLSSGFIYVPPPEVAEILPPAGREAGGTILTIKGNGFIKGASVTIGDKEGVYVSVINAGEIKIKTPPGSGVADVTVTNPDSQAHTLASGFTYLSSQEMPLPINITGIIPDSGSSSGGTFITITGRGFDDSTTVNIGGNPALNIVRVSENIIKAETPPVAYTPIPADIAVSNQDGSSARLNNGFRYVETGSSPDFRLNGYRIPPDSSDTRSIRFADIDNDGDPDIIAANIGKNRIYINDGAWTFTDETSSYLPDPDLEDETMDVELADIDSDGDIDIFFANRGTDRLLINNSGTGFTDETGTMMPAESPTYLQADEDDAVFGDIDNDGDKDLLLTYSGLKPKLFRNTIRWEDINNDGILEMVGGFADITPSVLPNTQNRAAVIADFTGNGIPDIVAANKGGEPYLLKDDLATLTYPFFLSMDAISLDAGDLNMDGKRDIIFGTSDGLRLYLGDGTGGFTESPERLPLVFDYVSDISIVDMDGDNWLDLLIITNGQNRVYINREGGYFTDSTDEYLPLFDVKGEAMDYWQSANGMVEFIITANGSLNQNRIYQRGTDTPIFQDITGNLPSDSTITRDISAGDIDNDGDLDIIMANDNNTMSRILINNGTGIFGDETVSRFGLSLPIGSAEEVKLADLNGDDYPDILIINDDFQQDHIYINDRQGNFRDETGDRLPQDSENGEGAAIGDIDSDGFPDVVIAEFGRERVLINDGEGRFTDETAGRFPFSEDNSNDTSAEVMLFDPDSDGDMDIFVINNDEAGENPTNRQNRLYLNNGMGFFTEMTSPYLPFENDHSRDGDTGDIDGDGDLDIVTANDIYQDETPENRIYFNDGTGRFSWSSLDTGGGSEDIKLSDIDGDGDLDIFVSNDTETENRLYINDGTGNFNISLNLPLLYDETNDAVIGDFDGDGDMDIIIGNTGQNRLMINGSR
ncbi:MAG: FG-GAP-like repeat-containing protein [Nitrospirota bacterium]